MRKVIVLDTSIFCVWLELTNFKSCGKVGDVWDFKRTDQKIKAEIRANSTFVLPLATIIETGNHISQIKGNRYSFAEKFSGILMQCVSADKPWAAFSEQSALWNDANLKKLARDFPKFAAEGISIGDATIKDVAEYYSKLNCEVEILTGDNGLKAYEPAASDIPIPRRRKK